MEWHDDLWYVGISFDITFEDYEDIVFYWRDISTSEFGYKDNYSTGCVQEGISAHIVAKIVYAKDECKYELEDIELRN